MTSKNSFWASSLQNHKRRIWVWVVAVLTQLLTYVGVLMVYFSRTRYFFANGTYRTTADFQRAMIQDAQDALGFQSSLFVSIVFLGVIIGLQGFSYLNDKRKVDLYHSVPVSGTKRFFVIYVNGIIVYLISTLLGLGLGTLVAVAQNAMTGTVLAIIGIAFLWNLLFFLVVYHTMILAVMLTGNNFISLCAFGVLAAYEPVLYDCISSFRYSFYERYNSNYVTVGEKFSAFGDYLNKSYSLKWMDSPAKILATALPYLGKWLVIAVVLLGAAFVCYRKRPSEAAGRAIAFDRCKPVVKLMVAVEAAMIVGGIIVDATYSNQVLMAVGMAVAAILTAAVMEVVYEFDIKCVIRHWVTSVAAVCIVLVIFCVYKFDLLGFDSYIPEAEQVESVIFQPSVMYETYWNEDMEYLSDTDYLKEHMFLTDAEDVIALAEKDQKENSDTMGDPRRINVLYRLKSGRNVERCFWVDFEDASNEEILNRLIGSEVYRKGMYQIAGEGLPLDQVQTVTYSNGATQSVLPLEDVEKLMDSYVQDMAALDFTLQYHSLPCGQITLSFGNYLSNTYLVYEDYTDVISYLKEQDAYYPVQLNAEDISKITITNYHNEVYEQTVTDDVVYEEIVYEEADYVYEEADYAVGYGENTSVTATFSDPEEIAEILENIYPSSVWSNWPKDGTFDANYGIDVEFRSDSDYPYNSLQYYFSYEFFAGQVPDFVVEATALE